MKSFKDAQLHDELLKAIGELGYKKPTEIQEKTIPHLLSSSRDIIATAQTGTGKTAAFGLPSIQLTEVYNTDTQTLVLCPTRELCIQITKY
jgi:ATP-dependent RNA helicase DeaD